MPRIRFESTETSLRILNPLKGFAEDVHRVEVRRDPLLGHKSIYNANLKDKVRFFFGDSDPSLIDELVRKTAKACPFCADNIEKSTPKYPSELLREGRSRRGEAVLFPNLYPLGKYHSVITLSKAHFLTLPEFTPAIIEDGLRLAQEFVTLVYRKDPGAVFVAVNANYLFPAGATLVHPHLQMLITPEPLTHQEKLIEAGESYCRACGTPYFLDLISEEKRIGSRYAVQMGNWHWIAAFSPLGMNEIIAVHEGSGDFGLLSETDVAHAAYGISRVLSLYEGLGHLSFNFTLLSARAPLFSDSYRCVLRMVNRQNLYANYRNDDYFLQKLLHSDFIINLPEELAPRLRGYF